MNKQELITTVARKAGITKVKAEDAVNALRETIVDQIAREGKFSLTDFGTFTVLQRQARTMKPFGKGEMEVPASKTVKFQPSPSLKELVN
jgi:DNA-binding protein HU-beta